MSEPQSLDDVTAGMFDLLPREVKEQLIEEMKERIRQMAWRALDEVPDGFFEDPARLGTLALIDSGIEMGMNAMAAYTNGVRTPSKRKHPDYQELARQEGDRVMKTDPDFAEQHNAARLKYGMDLDYPPAEDK